MKKRILWLCLSFLLMAALVMAAGKKTEEEAKAEKDYVDFVKSLNEHKDDNKG